MSESLFTFDNKYLSSSYGIVNTTAKSVVLSPAKVSLLNTISIKENQSDARTSLKSVVESYPITDLDGYQFISSYKRRLSFDGSITAVIPPFGSFTESVGKRYRNEELSYGNSLPLGGGIIDIIRSNNAFDNVSTTMGVKLSGLLTSLKTSLESNINTKQSQSNPITNTPHGEINMGDVTFPTIVKSAYTTTVSNLKFGVPPDIIQYFYSKAQTLAIPEQSFTETDEYKNAYIVDRIGRRVKTINTPTNSRLSVDIKQNLS